MSAMCRHRRRLTQVKLALVARGNDPTGTNEVDLNATAVTQGVVKRVLFVRHGHAQHNDATEKALARGVSYAEASLIGGEIRDPALTSKGEAQARALSGDPLLHAALAAEAGLRPTAVVVSPCRRTLQTATIGLASVHPPLHFVAQADAQAEIAR
jgi:hypothetical protein